MSVPKIIKFYVLNPEPCLIANGLNSNDIKQSTYAIFKSAFPQIDFYNMIFEKKRLFFDIKKYDSQKMFGTCSIDEAIRPTSFMQKRNKLTKEATPYTTTGGEEQLEAYIFFYIDFVNNRMAVIANKKISKIHEALCQFIWEKSGNLSKITILPEMIDDIKHEASKLIEPSWLELEMSKQNCIEDIPQLRIALGSDFQATRYKLKIQLDKCHNPNLVDRIMTFRKTNMKDVSLLKLIGKNELGVDETINFIESIYTKTVPLVLTDDTATNINYIENQLEEFLNSHLGNITKN